MYRPSLEDLKDFQLSEEGGGYRPSLEDIPLHLQDNPQNNVKFKISDYIPQMGIPSGVNMASGLMSLMSRNPEQQKMISDLPQIMSGENPSTKADIGHSIGRNAPSMMLPEARGGSEIINALSRIGGQTGFGAATNQNPIEGAKEFGGLQTGIEMLGALPRTAGKIAEWMNPLKGAGKTAEEIRNLAKEGLEEGEKYYKPVHEKYDNNWVTPKPKEYLGFHPEDTQYFKPEVNRAYRDFNAEPTFKNLHNLQHVMGKYPELYPMRQSVKQKLQSYLGNDKPMLESYNKGSDTLRDKYYPYIENDTLKNITEHKMPIKSFNVQELIKALKNSSIVQKAEKSAEHIGHPLVNMSKNLQDITNRGHALQYILPTIAGAVGGHFINPTLGPIGGSIAGSIFSKYAEPQLLKMSQNTWLINALKATNKGLEGAGRQVLGYHNYNKQ